MRIKANSLSNSAFSRAFKGVVLIPQLNVSKLKIHLDQCVNARKKKEICLQGR